MDELPMSYDFDMTTPSRSYMGYGPFGDYIGYEEDEDEEWDD